MTLRDLVFWLIGALALYFIWLCIRLALLRKRENVSLRFTEPEASSEAIHSQILGGDPARSYSSVHYDGGQEASVPETPARTEPRLSRISEPEAGAFGFDALLESRQTRHCLDELRLSHEALQQEVEVLKQEVNALRAACQVSPVYGEAVALAQRGYDVEAIAERCGISMAEAQLVQSLSADAKTERGNDDA